MVVLIVENASASLRGEISRWMIEPRAGVFVGKVPARVREKLWELVRSKMPKGGGMLIHNARTEQGFAIRSFGDTRRQIVDLEGISLVKFSGLK